MTEASDQAVALPVLTNDDALTDGRHHPSLKDMASEYIRRAIVTGDLRPGEKVAQDEVADSLGISRLPVREAVIELTAKGYVESVPRRGAFVARLAATDVLDHFQVLAAVFSLTSRRAAESISDEQLDQLRDLHERICTAQSDADAQRWEVLFYRTINRIGSSSRLLAILRFLALALPNDFYLLAPGRREVEERYRERILDALEAHEPDEAAAITQEHLRISGELTVEGLGRRGYWQEDTDGNEGAT